MSEHADGRRATGASGEALAASYLEARGWTVLERNWRCRAGELDIIARDPGGVLVACEVKTRRGLGYGDPLEAITRDKVMRLRRLTVQWILDHGGNVGPVRLDAVGVLVGPDGRARVRHIANLEAR